MREIITDTIELLGHKIHVIFNYRDYPILFNDADMSQVSGYKAPDGVATYCYRHNNDLILFLNNSKHNYTTPKVIYHLIKNAYKNRKPILNADQFWTWYTNDLAKLYYEDTNGNLINHIKNVHTDKMWDKPQIKKHVRHLKVSNKVKGVLKQSKRDTKTINNQHHTIQKLQKSVKDYQNKISNLVVNSYADKVFKLIQDKSNGIFHYSLYRFTELMRNLGLIDCTTHTVKEWMIDNGYLIKAGWNSYVPANNYSNLYYTSNNLLGHHKVELSQSGFVYFTNTIYSNFNN